jgi:hypothetical protein
MFSLASDYAQQSLIERISKVSEISSSKPHDFLELLNTHIDLPTLIPASFRRAYYASNTNDREYSLESILAILLLIQQLPIHSAKCFLFMLHFAPELREFCKLPDGKVPDESVLSKFKIKFEDELRKFFESLALKVMGIFDEYDATLPENSPHKGLNGTVAYDPTGLKPKVKENNPKTLESEIRRQSNVKKYLESNGQGKDFNVYLAAWKKMPKHAMSNEALKLCYANGHFAYFYKFGLLTNGFGIPLHIHFFDKDFYDGLPADFLTPEDQKYAYENASLAPMFRSFFANAGSRQFHTFLGDSEFDSYDNYGLLDELGFKKMLIPLNNRCTPASNEPIPRNNEGVPCCPKNPNTPFLPDGSCKGKNRSLRFKFVCPLSRKQDNRWVSDCDDKCRQTNSTVTTYTYKSEDLRTFPGILRGSKEWDILYKKRSIVEREISSMKSHPSLARPNTYNCASMRADVYLNASAKLITVILAFALGKPSYMRNLKNLLLAV